MLLLTNQHLIACESTLVERKFGTLSNARFRSICSLFSDYSTRYPLYCPRRSDCERHKAKRQRGVDLFHRKSTHSHLFPARTKSVRNSSEFGHFGVEQINFKSLWLFIYLRSIALLCNQSTCRFSHRVVFNVSVCNAVPSAQQLLSGRCPCRPIRQQMAESISNILPDISFIRDHVSPKNLKL